MTRALSPCIFRLSLLAIALFACKVNAQTNALPDNERPLSLRSSALLSDSINRALLPELPVFLFANHITTEDDERLRLEGNAEFRKQGLVVKADQLQYTQSSDRLQSTGPVRINAEGNIYSGNDLDLVVKNGSGQLRDMRFDLLRNGGQGKASQVTFLGNKKVRIENTTYTTCRPEDLPNWMPAWLLTAKEMVLDENTDIGFATGAVIRFKDVPIFGLPWMSFPLTDKRKSGFLPPVMNLDSQSGFELGIPYYWNIAPQMDMTLTPTLIARRGLNVGNDFRYLHSKGSGTALLDYLHEDRLRSDTQGNAMQRWSLASNHTFTFSRDALGAARWSGDMRVNRVSDQNYWLDFPRTLTSLTQRLLPNDLGVLFSQNDSSVAVRFRRWQVLQSTDSPIVPPYDKLPEINFRLAPTRWLGNSLESQALYTRFYSDPALTQQSNAHRMVLQTQISRQFGDAGKFVRPKLSVHATAYQFDEALSNGRKSAQRVLPTISLDSGMVFERPMQWQSREYRQTLEPRLLFVTTPFEAQSHLPNYDTGEKDLNIQALFSESPYIGHDRVADSRLLTLGGISRFIQPDTGAEVLRLGLAQRLRFADQNVTLPGKDPIQERYSDILTGMSLNWNNRLTTDTVVQYNPKLDQFERGVATLRYRPSPYRVLNFSYLLQRSVSSQVDFSWQWPLHVSEQKAGSWYSAGRLNYSLQDQHMVSSLLGFEYDGCCWVGRLALERLHTSAQIVNTRLLFQLELVGFSRVGLNALRSLRNNIPRYQSLHERTEPVSRFSQYE